MIQHYFIFYQVAMILSLIATLAITLLVWKRREAPGAKAMIVLTASTFIWTLGFLLETNHVTLEQQLLFNNVGYIGSMHVPIAWFIFASHYTSGNRLLRGWRMLPFYIIPLATIVLVWSNNWHHLMWSNEHLIVSDSFIVTAKTYEPLFWVSLTYNYILIFAGAYILIRRLFIGVPLYKGQAISLVVAVALPLIWNFIYVFDLVPLPHKDLTPVMFTISGVFIVLGLMRFQLFRIIPFARQFLIQQLKDAVLFFNTGNQLLEANPKALKLLGVDKNVIGKRLESLPALAKELKHLPSTDYARAELSLTVSGEERFFELEKMSMDDNHGMRVGWLAFLHDITERKRRELDYTTIIQTSVDGFWLMDGQGRFLDVNDAYCQLVGYSRSELLNMSISDIEANEKPEESKEHIVRLSESGQDQFETRHRHKDGRLLDVEVSVNHVNIGGGRLFVFIRDITERKRLQKQLIAQDRLVSIGEMTSGIAHEISNPLTTVIGYSDLLLKHEIPDEIRGDLEAIARGAERASKILDRLLTFSGQRTMEKDYVDINKIVETAIEFRQYSLSSGNIEVIRHFENNLPKVMADGSQLQDVFLNLITNAEYSMKETGGQGKLTIKTRSTGGKLYISFTDNGTGIRGENIDKIFEPFFTTKPTGVGTGLGLSICHQTINAHGGKIYAESEWGKGATFTIELPTALS